MEKRKKKGIKSGLKNGWQQKKLYLMNTTFGFLPSLP
jgi:hypothetical protein